MSQSHAAKAGAQHNTGLKSLDLLYAVLLHVLILIIIAVVAFSQQQPKDEPLKRIEVMMINAKDLAKLERQAQTVHKKPAIKHKKVKQKPKPKPKIKKQKTKIKKLVPKKLKKETANKPKTKPKSKPKPKKTAVIDDNFDPFAPVTSNTDVKSVPKKASTSHPELANLAGKQLSQSEKAHYIALMQAAVQRNWKVAMSAAKFSDPLVELKLLPSGAIAAIRILESSGNQALDASLIRAIEAAAPFELPSQQFEFFRLNRIRFHPLK
ncbi:MAG: energy transducer TonB [Mariprofundus sp.]|nr:energy transducer TonB [Mariprofundus sp.]